MTSTVAAPVRLTWHGILRSEWIRLTSLRFVWWTLAAVVVLMGGIALVAAGSATGSVQGPTAGGAPGLSGQDPLTTVLAGQTLVVIVVGVLGVVLGAREYGNGMIRTSMSVVPSRVPVLLSRVTAFVAAVGPAVLLGTLLAYAGGTAVLSAGGAATADWSDPGVPRAVLGTAAYLVGVGVLGICLGMLTRSLGSGIGALVATILVVPGLGRVLLPDDWSGALAWLPSEAATSFTTLAPGTDALETGSGAAVFGAWVLLAVVGAALSLVRRDV